MSRADSTYTIKQGIAALAYWRVELDSHDLLLAENAPAESFLAAPNVRRQLDGMQDLDEGAVCVACAERVARGPELEALRRRVILRAGLSVEPVCFRTMSAWLDFAEVRADGALRVAGWARNEARPDGPVCLDVMVNGVVVAMTLAEEYRADVEAAGGGRGIHGFDLTLDEPMVPDVAHTVEVRRSADGASVGMLSIDAAGTWNRPLAACAR
ncbi:hypothetical protein ACRAWG_19095 [Methylobacterium sp. P31]